MPSDRLTRLLSRFRDKAPRSGAGTAPRIDRSAYETRLEREIENYRECENVHDLPVIFHYWSNKYLLPKLEQFGFRDPEGFYCNYMTRACEEAAFEDCSFVSIGSGNCETEIEVSARLLKSGTHNFTLDCLDINDTMLDRGRAGATERSVDGKLNFVTVDVNEWIPDRPYRVVMANQCLHHFLELEALFDKIHDALHSDGYFVTSDMIGRNGHMRWPEALRHVEELWGQLPDRYKYNHQLQRLEREFDNWDCSISGFEGIRAQDILPLLIERFNFELFIGFGNVIDVFVDRSFGHNFDADREFDRAWIDRVQALDERSLESGAVKPTHMIAAMTNNPVETMTYKRLTPEFCVRRP